MKIHVVKPGDSVYKIAKEYAVTPEQIIHNNALENPDQLVVGQTLVIGIPKRIHTVNEGDTLLSIAKTHQLSIERLLRNNPKLIQDPTLHQGDSLIIEYEGEMDHCIIVNGFAYPTIDQDILNASDHFPVYADIRFKK